MKCSLYSTKSLRINGEKTLLNYYLTISRIKFNGVLQHNKLQRKKSFIKILPRKKSYVISNTADYTGIFVYGIKIDKVNACDSTDSETKVIANISYSKENVTAILRLVSDGEVTPVCFAEVFDELAI